MTITVETLDLMEREGWIPSQVRELIRQHREAMLLIEAIEESGLGGKLALFRHRVKHPNGLLCAYCERITARPLEGDGRCCMCHADDDAARAL